MEINHELFIKPNKRCQITHNDLCNGQRYSFDLGSFVYRPNYHCVHMTRGTDIGSIRCQYIKQR